MMGHQTSPDLCAESFRFMSIRPKQDPGAPPCNGSCPSGTNIRAWVGTIAQRTKMGLTKAEAYRRAWEIVTDRNPLPATMGRVCPHPCESQCSRSDKDGAVSVNELERFIGDYAIERGWPLTRLSGESRSETVAVVGAGPAGLSFAYQMARRGYPVTMFDRHAKAGGMLRYGIPDYRLPPGVLDAEIARITDLGIHVELGTRVGRDLSIDDLRRDFEIVFVGIGAQTGRRLRIPGEDGPNVWVGTDYLHRLNRGEAVDAGCTVVVVGGGNTAIDAARSARRYGSAVTLLYRRTRVEMPAIADEIDEAIEEEVEIVYLAAPTEIVRNEIGHVCAVRVQQMELGAPDAGGRRRPVPIEGSTFNVPATAVIVAISQEPDWTGLDALRHAGLWISTAAEGLMGARMFAGGDIRGLGTASLAIGHGRAAAEAAHARRSGGTTSGGNGLMSSRRERPRVKLELYDSIPRVELERLAVVDRLADPLRTVTETMSEDEFLREVSRCLSCESCFGCQHCFMYCNASGFIELADPGPGRYFRLDLSVCEGCGKCIEVCPCGYLAPEA